MSHHTPQNPAQSPIFTRKNQNPSPPIKVSHQNTHLFAPKPQRFHYSHSQNPGPGTYTNNMETERTITKPVVPESKEFLWITDKGRQLFETRSSWKQNLGPGKYTHTEHPDNHSNWPKKQRFNYLRSQMATAVGPGIYDTNYSPKQLPAASSAFNSKTSKSYLAEKISQLVKFKESTNNPENGFEPIKQQALFENQHHYQRSSQKKRGSPVFVSNCERLPTIQSDKVGPGYYEVGKSTKINYAGRRVITESHTNRPKQSLTKHESHRIITPGPGAYNQLQSNYLESSKKPLLGVMFKEQRFRKQRTQSNNTPGPADYQINSKKVKAAMMSDNKHSKGQNITNKLKGSVVRKIFAHHSEFNHSSQTNIYQLFRKMQREKEAAQEEFEGLLY